MRGRRSGAGALGAVVAIVLLLAGCASLRADDDGGARAGGSDSGAGSGGGSDEDGEDPEGGAGHTDDAGEVLLQVTTSGGFVPIGWDFQTVPSLTVHADGLAITHGPTTLEYPGRLLPHLVTHRLTADGLARLEDAADDAGLLAPAPDYGRPHITDVGTTTVTLTVDGETWEHQAYALNVIEAYAQDATGADDGAADGLDENARSARAALTDFLDTVWAEVDAAEETGPFEPDRYAVMVLEAADGEPSGDLPVGEHAWPLEELAEVDCRVIEGADADAVGAVLRDARQGDRFTHDGVTYDVWVRVLLPGEPGCTAGERAPRR